MTEVMECRFEIVERSGSFYIYEKLGWHPTPGGYVNGTLKNVDDLKALRVALNKAIREEEQKQRW